MKKTLKSKKTKCRSHRREKFVYFTGRKPAEEGESSGLLVRNRKRKGLTHRGGRIPNGKSYL